MDSVNLALQLVLRRANVETPVDFYYPHVSPGVGQERSPPRSGQNVSHGPFKQEFRSAHAHLDELMDSTAVLFWGDFLHMAQYHRTIARRLLREGHVHSEREARNYTQDIFFLSRARDDVLRRSISFGGTVIFNTLEDELHGEYAREFTRFVGRTRKIWSRDVFSSIKLSHLTSDYTRSRLGVDCALLIRNADVQSLCGVAESTLHEAVSDKIGVFFGRSRGVGFRLMHFALSIARERGQKLYWLPWGSQLGFPAHRRWLVPRPAALNAMRGCEQLIDTVHMLSALMHSSLVITDTYHVAVNAWNLGTPAICIGDPSPFETQNVNSGTAFGWRDKRQTFFSMYDALDFFVYAQELRSWRWTRRRTRHVLDKLRDESITKEIVRRMHRHRDSAEAELVSELRLVLSE